MKRTSLVIGASAALLVLVLDQLSKEIILHELGPGAARDVVTVIPGVLRLIFVRNTGSAFGMFQGGSEWLRVLAVVGVAVLAFYFVRVALGSRLMSLALGLQLGGALGNIVDRFRHGYVVDWIDVPRWPTFNLADSAITVGVILLMYALLFQKDDRSPSESQRESPGAQSPVGEHG